MARDKIIFPSKHNLSNGSETIPMSINKINLVQKVCVCVCVCVGGGGGWVGAEFSFSVCVRAWDFSFSLWALLVL